MTEIIQTFVGDARAYCDARGIKLSTLAAYAVGDNTLFDRLDRGGECLPRTMKRVREYMAENPAHMPRRPMRKRRPVPKVNVSDMLVETIRRASDVTGLAKSTICNRLFGNTLLPVTARMRADRAKAQIEALNQFIADHESKAGETLNGVNDAP